MVVAILIPNKQVAVQLQTILYRLTILTVVDKQELPIHSNVIGSDNPNS